MHPQTSDKQGLSAARICKCSGFSAVGSAHVWGARGRWFESSNPDRNKSQVVDNQRLGFFFLSNLHNICTTESSTILRLFLSVCSRLLVPIQHYGLRAVDNLKSEDSPAPRNGGRRLFVSISTLPNRLRGRDRG